MYSNYFNSEMAILKLSVDFIDFNQLSLMIGNHEDEVLLEITAEYFYNLIKEIILIEKSILKGDFLRIRELAHSAKGASYFICANKMGEHFELIEINHTNLNRVSKEIGLIKNDLESALLKN